MRNADKSPVVLGKVWAIRREEVGRVRWHVDYLPLGASGGVFRKLKDAKTAIALTEELYGKDPDLSEQIAVSKLTAKQRSVYDRIRAMMVRP